MRAKSLMGYEALGLFAVLLSLVVGFACGNKEEGATGGPTPPTETTTPPAKAAPAPRGYEELATVEHAGRISGTVSYAGTKQAATLDVTKDHGVCTHGGEPDGSLVVNGGKLANALIYLVDVARGKSWGTQAATLDNNQCLFSPRVVVSRHRANLSIKNSDPLLHNTNLTLREGSRTLGNISLPRQNQVIERSLAKQGLVDVKCDVHPWMQAFVWVSSHPYATVSAADGTFSIDGVPPGDYQVKAWHEVLGEKEMRVTVAPDGAATLDVAFE
jgi:hypothetical protein